jgi:hypothetical protein
VSRVVDEEWELTDNCDGHPMVVFPEDRAFVVNEEDIDRARLASCAPEMARMLLELEWNDREDSAGNIVGKRCFVCGAETWFDDDTPAHRATCRLVNLLKWAGVLE